jgi:hypothetical protein
VERPDDEFAAEYFGGNDDDWFFTNHGGAGSADSSRWDYLTGQLANKSMANEENYREMQEYLDVTSFVDYLLTSFYVGLTDWPSNNWYVILRNKISPLGPTPAQFQAWDGEWALDRRKGTSKDGATIPLEFINCSTSSSPIVKLWCSLRQSDEFMKLFAYHVALHTAPGGALSTDVAIARWDSLNTFIESAIVGESARWGDSLKALGGMYDVTRTRNEDWQNEVNLIRKLLQGNTDQLIKELKDAGLYAALPNPPLFSPNGGDVSVGSIFTISNPNGSGSIVYTTDGTDPTSSSSAWNYNGPIMVDKSVFVQATVSKGGLFSVVSVATFKTPTFALTEIHYHPSEPTPDEVVAGFVADSFEFIKLRNVAQVNLDVAYLVLDKGITVSNLNPRIVSPGEDIVLVSDLAAFTNRYPGALSQVVGVYEGKLSNGGEQIVAQYPAGIVIFSFDYDDEFPWPVEADGTGPSLQVVDITGDLNDPSNWIAAPATPSGPTKQSMMTNAPVPAPSTAGASMPSVAPSSETPLTSPTLLPPTTTSPTAHGRFFGFLRKSLGGLFGDGGDDEGSDDDGGGFLGFFRGLFGGLFGGSGDGK